MSIFSLVGKGVVTCIGHRVVSPDPRGKGTPEMASSTELLPLLWSPVIESENRIRNIVQTH
jgi:hypothetical protein